MDLLSLLPIVAIFLIFWLLVIRPASKRQRALQSVQESLSIGDDVITSSGLFGTIRSIEGDKVGLEVADGVVLTLARGAIVGQTPDEDGANPVVDELESDEPVSDESRDEER